MERERESVCVCVDLDFCNISKIDVSSSDGMCLLAVGCFKTGYCSCMLCLGTEKRNTMGALHFIENCSHLEHEST
jgi:hypothetical protein